MMYIKIETHRKKHLWLGVRYIEIDEYGKDHRRRLSTRQIVVVKWFRF